MAFLQSQLDTIDLGEYISIFLDHAAVALENMAGLRAAPPPPPPPPSRLRPPPSPPLPPLHLHHRRRHRPLRVVLPGQIYILLFLVFMLVGESEMRQRNKASDEAEQQIYVYIRGKLALSCLVAGAHGLTLWCDPSAHRARASTGQAPLASHLRRPSLPPPPPPTTTTGASGATCGSSSSS